MARTKQTVTEEAPQAQVDVPPRVVVRTVDMSLPVASVGPVVLRRLDLRMTDRQAQALRLLFDGLTAEGEAVRIPGNPTVSQTADALRWVLDKIADAVGLPL